MRRWRSVRRGLTQGTEKREGGAGEEQMLGHPFIGSEGERRRWCTIMAMKAAVSEGDRLGSDEGGCSGRYRSGRGRGTGRR
jgi:hypothetical protein